MKLLLKWTWTNSNVFISDGSWTKFTWIEQTFSRYFQNVSMCRYRYFLSNVSMYRYNTVSIHFKSIWYRYFFNHFLGLISVFIAFLCDNFCRNSKLKIIMFKNNVKRFLKYEILSKMEKNCFFYLTKIWIFLNILVKKEWNSIRKVSAT